MIPQDSKVSLKAFGVENFTLTSLSCMCLLIINNRLPTASGPNKTQSKNYCNICQPIHIHSKVKSYWRCKRQNKGRVIRDCIAGKKFTKIPGQIQQGLGRWLGLSYTYPWHATDKSSAPCIQMRLWPLK